MAIVSSILSCFNTSIHIGTLVLVKLQITSTGRRYVLKDHIYYYVFPNADTIYNKKSTAIFPLNI